MRDGKPPVIISVYGPPEILFITFQATSYIAFRLFFSAGLRPANWNIHCQGRGASDYCQRFVQDQPPLLSEDGRSSHVRCYVPATGLLSFAFLSSCAEGFVGSG